MKEPKTTTIAPSNGKKDSSHIGGSSEGMHKKKNPDKARDMIKNNAPHLIWYMLSNKMWANFSSKNIDKSPE